MTEIIEVTDDLRKKYNNQLLEFEQNFIYPFGHHSFVISHGYNYFKFFDSLGKPYILAITDKDRIVGVAVFILRNIDIYSSGKSELVWYICDLKIHPDYRGKFIIRDIFNFAVKKYGAISPKIYGISMNSMPINNNRLINLANRIPIIDLSFQSTLFFYLMRKTQFDQISQTVKLYHNELGYFSNIGVKDLVMTSSAKPMPLIHVGPFNKSNNVPSSTSDDYFMFCIPSFSLLIEKLELVETKPVAKASIISNITDSNWNFILSSEI